MREQACALPYNLDLDALLRPFVEQSAPIRAILADSGAAAGSHQMVLFRLAPDDSTHQAIIAREAMPVASGNGAGPAYTLAALARAAREICASIPGNDLLVLPTHLLHELLPPANEPFGFRAVAVLLPGVPDSRDGENGWKWRRSWFDCGLVCIGSVPCDGAEALCFLASDLVRCLDRLDAGSRGHVAMSRIAEHARFANQLFRYACVKLYALRHGLTPALPDWEGRQLFALNDPSSEGMQLPRLTYEGFASNDREIWDREDPPIDIDLDGYFQEIPACWRRHRPLLRRLFQLPAEHRAAMDAWREKVTDRGRRTLVAIHIRRGDYRKMQAKLPYFRLVPEAWYLAWLRAIWPLLDDPLLYVATDEPDSILPQFQEFEMAPHPATAGTQALSDYVRDFEILRRADYLALCNSSFSRMAGILAPASQKCFLPSFEKQCFEPYEPWIDPEFWARFANTRAAPRDAASREMQTLAATVFFDLSDLLHYLLYHNTLSGIQRVQYEILRNLLELPGPQSFRFVVLNRLWGVGAIEFSALVEIIEEIRLQTASGSEASSKLRALVDHAVPCTLETGDIFISLGAFWNIEGMGLFLQELKNSGVIVSVLIHDLLPIMSCEYFEAREAGVFIKSITEALAFSDFILTVSEYSKACLSAHIASLGLEPPPIEVVSSGHGFFVSSSGEAKISRAVSRVLERDYVLCVGTIEARKNPGYLFNLWKMMVRSGRPDTPYLVFVGRKGWLVNDFLEQLKASNYLDGTILILHDVTDTELDLLYRKCILTVFPSFVEGWGLPVGESLAHGKVCLCSPIGGIPEVGGELADYIDPFNIWDGLEHLSKYLDDPELRRKREGEIAAKFEPRSWREAAGDLMRSTRALAKQSAPLDGVAAMTLPANVYLPISSDTRSLSLDATEGALSAELACVSGWCPPEVSGVRAAKPIATIRFRSALPVGTAIHIALRIAAFGRDFQIRIRSGAAETDVNLAAGVDTRAALRCEAGTGRLITLQVLTLGATLEGDRTFEAHWLLKGFSYSGGTAEVPAPRDTHIEPPSEPESSLPRVLLRQSFMDETRRADSAAEFQELSDSYWESSFPANRRAPLFATREDREAFHTGCGDPSHVPQLGTYSDSIRLIRRSDQFVSTSRFSEGSVFDRSGVWKSYGYLESCSSINAPPWLSHDRNGLSVGEDSLSAAPYYDHSFLIFYNGNLHNYYHWMVEGLLCLDILWNALGRPSNSKVGLPKSVDICAVFDHRESLRTAGFGELETVEIEPGLIRVREAIWVDCDLVQATPAQYLQRFQQRIAARYGNLGIPRSRRLLIGRKGPTRIVDNLNQVQRVLSEYNFETVYLEGMTVRDQILLFQSAEFLIGAHGAGLANLLFCEPGTKVIELSPSVELRPFFWTISGKLDLVYGLLFCPSVGERQFQSAISVDPVKLQTLIRILDGHL